MHRARKIAIGAVAAGSLAVTGIGTSVAASSSTSHTIHFTAVTLKSKNLSKSEFTQAEKDVRNGRIIGLDLVYGRFTHHSATGTVTFTTKGGVLYGTLTFTNSPTTTGKVTGGTGKFKGARGTITGTGTGKRTKVTIKYHN